MFKFLDGYKTKIAGMGSILLGLSMIAKSLSTGFSPHDLAQGVGVVLAGFTTLGIGGKLQKIIDVSKAV